MTDQETNIAIAELLGISRADIDAYLDWQEARRQFEHGEIQEDEFYRRHLRVDPEPRPIPSYTTDLNAMHEVEKTLTLGRALHFDFLLRGMVVNQTKWESRGDSFTWHATARQRAEAFLRTIGK